MSEFSFPTQDGPARDYFNFFAANVALDPARQGFVERPEGAS